MNDENENIVNAESSLCWNCKFGICVKETEQEKVYQSLEGNPGSDQFALFEDSSFQENESLVEHTVENERVKTICFWRPEHIQNSPPILVANILQCNRFEARKTS